MAVVTISRQVGSFGDQVAELVAQRMGYELVTRERLRDLARSCDAEFKKACAAFESEVSKGLWDRLFFSSPSLTSLFEALNLELASQDRVVILGRGAQVVLSGLGGVFKARVVAPAELRVARVMERERISRDEAADYVRTFDHQRRSFLESVYQKSFSDWSLYDLVLNTAALGPEAAAELICRGLEVMPQPADQEAWRADLSRRALAKRVEGAVKQAVLTTPYHNVEISVDASGRLLLQGCLRDKTSRARAAEVAASQPGVSGVDNRIRVTDLSF